MRLADIPTCSIMGTGIAAIDMPFLVDYVESNLDVLRGNYICVSNVHTTVMGYRDEAYMAVQNGSAMCIPDGGPLSSVGRRRGFSRMARTTGPDLMRVLFERSEQNRIRHYFYGSTDETLAELDRRLKAAYPAIEIVGMFSPPFRALANEEAAAYVDAINKVKPDIVWVGLGAPKQERWMAAHEGKVNALMVGVGAGFDYFAGNIKRAPEWMQRHNLEWAYRLMQDPKRLLGRYLSTNASFVLNAMILGK